MFRISHDCVIFAADDFFYQWDTRSATLMEDVSG